MSSFLDNRWISVAIDGYSSSEFSLNAIVPQDSVLSPSLCLVFINGTLCVTENPTYSLADGSTLCSSYSFYSRPSMLIDRKLGFNATQTQSGSLMHRKSDEGVNVEEWAMGMLICRHIHCKCSTDVKEICPSVKSFNTTKRLFQRSHPIVPVLLAHRTTYPSDSSFFSRTVLSPSYLMPPF